MDEQELRKRLQAAFREEAGERLLSIENHLVVLEKETSETESASAIETVFRDVHSLKGAARAVGLQPLEMFFQSAENVFSALKKGHLKYNSNITILLQRGIGSVECYMKTPDNPENMAELQGLCREMDSFMHGEKQSASAYKTKAWNPSPKTESAAAPEITPSSRPVDVNEKKTIAADRNATAADRSRNSGSSVRVNKEKIDGLLQESDELIALKMIFSERLNQLNELSGDMQGMDKLQRSFKNILLRINREIKALEQDGTANSGKDNFQLSLELLERNLENLGGRLEHFSHQLSMLSRSGLSDARTCSKMIDEFREELKTIALMPFSSLSSSFPRMMREIARETGRNFEFVMSGGDIEIDRRILDELRDPLIHLLRNSADHGIEPEGNRIAAGKSLSGRISLSVSVTSDKKIEIIVSDDGGGMDLDALRLKIAEKFNLPIGIVNALPDDKVINYIFLSGFSTSKIITSLSGRGLGMAIVREKVENVGGTIRIDNRPGQGCTFTILLPAALSAQRGILLKAGGRMFALPTNGLLHAALTKRESISSIKGVPSITVRGDTIPVFDLAGILELQADKMQDVFPVLVMSVAGIKAALIVEAVIQEIEMIVKPLGCILRRVRNIAGVVITGSGAVVPVLNSRDLFKSGLGGQHGRLEMTQMKQDRKQPVIMIAEDSITSRTLLTNILEAAGYRVITAVDGMAAWKMLEQTRIDLLVSDIEMPRLDGFGLTEKIRADQRLTGLPVVLVTSLARREDREHGIACGADAYITKSDFSQNHLLETIERLL
ncbi:MAG: response regulator [Victivallaceae bacterium]|jgi:two-component system chemotaxis sensor kinase CheA